MCMLSLFYSLINTLNNSWFQISPDKFGAAPPARRGRKKVERGGAADRTKCCNRREMSALTELSDSDLLLPVEPTTTTSPSTPRVVGASQCKSARRPAKARRRPPPQLIAEENSFTDIQSPVPHRGKRTQFAKVLDTPPSRDSAVVYATNTPDHLMGVSMATRHRIARS